MRSPLRSLGAGIILSVMACSAMALGFGRTSHASLLGQPLSFTVPLRFESDEFVSAECVTAEVFSGDNRVPPANVRVTLDPGHEPQERTLRIVTTASIDEPVVSVNVGVGCPVRLSRKFFAFIDPPLVQLAQSAPPPASAPAAPAAQAPLPATAIAPAAPSAASAGAAPRVRRPRPAGAVARAPAPAASLTVQETPRPSAQRARRAPPTTTAKAGGPRLQLEGTPDPAKPPAPTAPASAAAVAAPPAAVAAAPAASASPAASAPGAATLADQAAAALNATLPAGQAQPAASAEQERLRQLEDSLNKLRAESEATRGNVAALQSRLREAEAARFANPLVYGLAALAAVLAFALACLLWWARERERKRAAWWMAATEEAEQRVRVARETRAPEPVPEPGLAPPVVVPQAPPAKGPVTWKPTAAIPELDASDVPRRAVSAEELIDLEQQAEFFVTLGQDDAAIDLLATHIDTTGGISPLPYLKLLEIHRRHGDLEAYERLRQQFNQRFNAYAPAWDDDTTHPRTLEDHADVLAQLQEAWPTPPRAMGLLEVLLFRQGAGDAVFDLSAYREVLFLYEIARQLAERRESPATVDLELPFDEEASSLSALTRPLRATMPLVPHPEVSRPLRVDVDLAGPEDPQKSFERSERYEGSDFVFGTDNPSSNFASLSGKGTPRKR